MRRFAGHQEGQRVFHAGIVGHVDQAFIDDLRPRLRRDIRPQVGGGFADSINEAAVHGTPAELVSGVPPPYSRDVIWLSLPLAVSER